MFESSNYQMDFPNDEAGITFATYSIFSANPITQQQYHSIPFRNILVGAKDANNTDRSFYEVIIPDKDNTVDHDDDDDDENEDEHDHRKKTFTIQCKSTSGTR